MTQRDRLMLIALVSVAAVVAAWMLVISPRSQELSQLNAQAQGAQSQLTALRATLAQEQAAKAAFSRSYAQLTRLGEAVPADDDVPSLLYQIQSAAIGAGVGFHTIQLTPGSGGPAPAAAAGTNPTQLPPGVAVGAAGFPSEDFSFTFEGNFFRLSNFFARLENQVVASRSSLAVSGRLLTLNAISLQQATSGFPNIQATVSATAYVVPAAQGLLAGATAAGPAQAAPVPAGLSTSSTPTGASSTPPAVVIR